jgi:hypothetical protein
MNWRPNQTPDEADKAGKAREDGAPDISSHSMFSGRHHTASLHEELMLQHHIGFMKTLTLILCLLLGMKAAQAFVVIPPAAGTNELAEIYRVSRINAALNNGYYYIGRIDRLEQEVDRLEAGFLILAVLIGSSLASLCLLAARDSIRKQREIPEKGSKMEVNEKREETN